LATIRPSFVLVKGKLRSWPTAAAAAVAAAGLVWLSRQAPPFREVSDGAILELYTLEALRGRLLLGPYSRFGWHHPGPLFFYLEAPWYWASGLHTAGMQAGALAINLAAVFALARTVAANASTTGVAAMCATVSWYVWRTGAMIVSPWNPHVIVLPMLALIVAATASAAAGRGALLPALVLGGSFLLQTHVAVAPIVVLVMVLAGAAGRDAVRAGWPAAVGLATAAWLPVIVEQATHHPGNLTRIASFFAESAEHQTIGHAATAWSAALTGAFRGGFAVARGVELRPVDGAWPMLCSGAVVVLLAIAARRAHGRRDAFAMWLAVTCGLTSIVALLATIRIRDRIIDHEVFWISALGAIDAAAIAGGLARPIRRPALSAIIAALLVVFTAAAGLAGMRQVLARPRTIEDHSVDALAQAIEQYAGDSRVQRPLIHIDQQIWPIAAGALLIVRKHGLAFAVDDRWTTMFGEAFERNGGEDGEVTITGSPRLPRLVVNR